MKVFILAIIDRHQCMEICYLKNISGNCHQRCELEYDHDGRHICGEEHYCNRRCYFFGRSRNCREKCELMSLHEGPCNCEVNHDQN